MILLFTCAHCFAYQEVEEDVYDLQSGFCFECKHCHKDTVVLLATEKDYHVAADAIAAQQGRAVDAAIALKNWMVRLFTPRQ